jgi:hypothetical protein
MPELAGWLRSGELALGEFLQLRQSGTGHHSSTVVAVIVDAHALCFAKVHPVTVSLTTKP